MLKKFLLFCLLLLITYCHKDNPVSSAGQTAANTWAAKADMPTARGYFCGAEVNGKIYLFGGLKDLSLNNSDDVESYDPETDTWTIKNKMPEKIFGQAAAELDGKIYMFGGRTGDIFGGTTLNSTYLYDPTVDTWTKKADMPKPKAFMTASVVDGKIYTIGGAETGYVGVTDVQMYDPATNTWVTKVHLPHMGRALQTANVYNGKIYVIGGGYEEANVVGTAFPYFDVYDPVNNSWDSKQDIAQGRIGHGSSIINNKLYIYGGFSSNTELLDLNEYDFNNNIWTARTSMPFTRRCFASCVYNNNIFIFGGISGAQGSQQVLNSVMEYIPPAASN